MATGKAFFFECFRSHGLWTKPRYPSMPKYPKGSSLKSPGRDDPEAAVKENKATALFSVIGMTCSACAGSVEKAIKRLPGIHDAAVDLLSNRAQVLFYPAFVSVSVEGFCLILFLE